MCGRYATSSPVDWAVVFRAEDATGGELAPSFNVAPTDPAPIVVRDKHTAARSLRVARWGLVPSWAKDRKDAAKRINARIESVENTPAFRSAVKSRRCLVPAAGFYEWITDQNGKQPYYIHSIDGAPLSMAGLYEHWRDPASDSWWSTYTVLTTSAADDIGQIHDRSPVLVPPGLWDEWLNPDRANPGELLTELVPAAAGSLDAYPVGKQVNSVRNNGPELIVPVNLAEPMPLPLDE